MKPPRAVARRQPPPFTVEELRQISTEISADWFRPDPASHLTLLEIDPWNLLASWHVDPAAFAASRLQWQAQHGEREPQLVLRCHDLTPQTPGFVAAAPFDIVVHPASEQHYFNLWRDGRHLVAELGWRDASEGAFQALLRSNEVVLPRSGPSPARDSRNAEWIAPAAASLPALPAATPPFSHSSLWLDHLIAPLMPPPLTAADFLAAGHAPETMDGLSVPPLPVPSADMVAPAGMHWLHQKVGAGGMKCPAAGMAAADWPESVSASVLPALGSSPTGGFRARREAVPDPGRFAALPADDRGEP